jgi:hypothetical protein
MHAFSCRQRLMLLFLTVQDNFFWLTDPKPCEPKDLPKFDASHELDMKRKRQAEREQRQQVFHPSPMFCF